MASFAVSAFARADIREIIDFLELSASRSTALRYAVAFDSAIDRVKDFPQSGSPRPGLGAYTRVIVIDPWLMFYEHDVAENAASILRVLHGRRDITADLIRQR